MCLFSIHSPYMPVMRLNYPIHLHAFTRSEKRRPLIIVFLAVGTGLVFASYLYSIDTLALLYYSDSVSHLVRARQLVDNSSPGLHQLRYGVATTSAYNATSFLFSRPVIQNWVCRNIC